MKVSVIIPVYNAERYIQSAVESALAQADVETEVVVVDDASTDGSAEILRSLRSERLKVISLPVNRGGAAARNIGVQRASGECLAFLDADDLFLPHKLATQISFATDSLTDLDMVTSWFVLESGLVVTPDNFGKDKIDMEAILTKRSVAPTSGWLLRREAFDRIGGFTPEFPRHQDIEFLVRFLRKGTIRVAPHALFERRISGQPKARRVEAAMKLYRDVFKADIGALTPSQRHALDARLHARLSRLKAREGNFGGAFLELLSAVAASPRAAGASFLRRLRIRSQARAFSAHSRSPTGSQVAEVEDKR